MAVFGLAGIGAVGALIDPDGDSTADGAPTAVERPPAATHSEVTSAPSRPAASVGRPLPDVPESVALGGTLTVTNVVDGDTVDVSSGERVRLIGIDTPERGECGFDAATRRVEQLVTGASIALVPGAREDVDRYGRILRYVDADGVDVGQVLLEEGLAISRYDSRDGYGAHVRESTYHLADIGSPQVCRAAVGSEAAPPVPSVVNDVLATGGAVHFQNCDAARAAGAAPLVVGDPGYRSALDRDDDGIACE